VKLKVQDNIKYKFDIIWKGNPISCVKSFGSRGCNLCKRERLAILRATHQHKKNSINYCSEIYGACRHKPQFPRYRSKQKIAGTDESEKDERVYHQNSTTSQSTTKTSESEEERTPLTYEDANASLNNFKGNRAFFPTSEDEVYGDSSFAPASDEFTLLGTDSGGEPVSDLGLAEDCCWST
jgi:hypothetical protein